MPNNSSIIQSLEFKSDLYPKFWDETGNSINGSIRNRLLEIAYEFINFIGLDVFVDDVILTGSLVNYNWSDYSDVDLHIVINYQQFPEDQVELLEEIFRLKKILFNLNHQIKIFKHDVEVYVQDSNEEHYSSGIYSLVFDTWVKKPSKQSDFTIDEKLLSDKVKSWTEKIDELIQETKDLSPEYIDVIIDRIQRLKDKLKSYRSKGLETSGETSYENLTFKVLRRNGYIQKLFDYKNNILDKNLSLG